MVVSFINYINEGNLREGFVQTVGAAERLFQVGKVFSPT
jgi:hypothetical protein